MGKGAGQMVNAEKLAEGAKQVQAQECNAQSSYSLQKAPDTSAQVNGKGCQEQRTASVEARPERKEQQAQKEQQGQTVGQIIALADTAPVENMSHEAK